MNNENIWDSVAKKLAGESSNEDEATVQDWINEDKSNKIILKRLTEIWQFNPKRIHDNTAIYRKYQQRKINLGNRKIVPPVIYYAVRISAVLFFLVATTFFVNNIIISNRQEVSYQQITVPKGSRSSFNLPDGTKVWLSNNSSIRYPSKFLGKTRELEIEGEAYFEVTHDRRHPFIVNIGNDRIVVLGTHFSVTAYPDDKIVRTDLVEGKIRFDIADENGGYKSYLVKPSHSLVLDKASGKLSESKVPDGFYDYWHKGIYEFRNESLEELAVKIDRIYNTQIIFEDEELKSKRFSGTISVDDNIFTFIEAVKSTSTQPIQYRYEKNKLYINRNKN